MKLIKFLNRTYRQKVEYQELVNKADVWASFLEMLFIKYGNVNINSDFYWAEDQRTVFAEIVNELEGEN